MTLTGLDPALERLLDLAGVAVFALSGALLQHAEAVRRSRIAVLALTTGLAPSLIMAPPPRKPTPVTTLEAIQDRVLLVFVSRGTTNSVKP